MKKVLFTLMFMLTSFTVTLVTSSTPTYAYTEAQKAQAKAWLSSHGYAPTRAGAEQAYADYKAGKWNDKGEAVNQDDSSDSDSSDSGSNSGSSNSGSNAGSSDSGSQSSGSNSGSSDSSDGSDSTEDSEEAMAIVKAMGETLEEEKKEEKSKTDTTTEATTEKLTKEEVAQQKQATKERQQKEAKKKKEQRKVYTGVGVAAVVFLLALFFILKNRIR